MDAISVRRAGFRSARFTAWCFIFSIFASALASCTGGGRSVGETDAGAWDESRLGVDNRILSLTAREDFDAMLALVDSLEGAGVSDPRLTGQKALALAMTGREREAIPLFEKSLLADYANCENHLNFAVMLMRMGKTGRARTEFIEARKFCGAADQALIMRNMAVADIKAGREDQAFEKIAEGLDYAPKDPYLLGLKGMLLAEESPSVAESLMANSREMGDIEPEFLYQLGMIFLRSGKFEPAAATLEVALESEPKKREIVLALADALAGSGRRQESETLLHALAVEEPGEDITERLARMAFSGGRYEEAKEYYEELPESAEVLDRIAMSLRGMGKLHEALKIERRAVSLDPEWPVGLVNLSVILGAIGELDEAEELLHRVLSIDPENLAAKINLERIQRAREEAGK